jgi:hypothetical protein
VAAPAWVSGATPDPAATPTADATAKDRPSEAIHALVPASTQPWTTTDSSRVIQLREGTRIVLGPNTRVTQLAAVPVPLGIKDAAPRVFCLELAQGTLDVEIAHDSKPIHGVLVHAPRKVSAIVKVGRATLSAQGESTTVAARAGYDMSVSVAEHWRPLRVGRAFTVTANLPQGVQRNILHAPVAQVTRPVALALGANVPTQRITWQPLPESLGYWLRLYRYEAAQPRLVRTERVSRSFIDLVDLEPGHYEARVTAIDPSGVETAESTPLSVRLVGAILPAGAYATATAVYLPPEARLAFAGSDELEVAYGGSGGLFVAAPPAVGLHDGKAVSLRLRQRGSSEEAVLKLEPIDIQPRIELSPSRAVWPGDPVTVRVLLRRRNGARVIDENHYVATVSINAQPVLVDWTRSAGMLTASLEKPPFPGPWVVRVNVEDTQGRVFARNFIEIAVDKRNDWIAAEGL